MEWKVGNFYKAQGKRSSSSWKFLIKDYNPESNLFSTDWWKGDEHYRDINYGLDDFKHLGHDYIVSRWESYKKEDCL